MEKFEKQFREWWGLMWDNHFEHSQSEYDVFEEIDEFLKSPDDCLLAEQKWRKEMDEEMQKSMEEDIKSGAFNPDEEVKT
tara:strand:+ start:501 stop:740 length:240 start_codon:yes stop_codon:yes gene_type:complete